MCKNMDELFAVANQVYELEQKKAKKKKEVDELESQIKALKDEVAVYMKKRQKNELEVEYYKVLYTPFERPQFDSKAFIANEKKGKELYDKYFPNGGGSIFTFEVKGGEEEAKKFIDNLQLFSLLANVADAKSLVIHPASTTHSQLNEEELAEQGIKPNTVRLSIGLEHIDDILFDLEEAFKAI